MTPDPQFPQRPTHRDFETLSDIVIEFDRKADERADGEENVFEASIRDHGVDEQSLIYMAMQRGMRVLGLDTMEKLQENAELLVKISALYAEAFLVGTDFEKRRDLP